MMRWFYNRWVDTYNISITIYNAFVGWWNHYAPGEADTPTEIYNQQIDEYNQHVDRWNKEENDV